MKNENIKKINTLGKISRIILIIMRIVLIIGIVVCLLSAIAFCFMPKSDVITADGTVSAQIKIDCEQIPSIIFSDDIIDLDENNIDFNFLGTGFKWFVEKNKVNDILTYDIEDKLNIDNSYSVILGLESACAFSAALCAVMLIVVIFGGKLAKALEICESPFEENVLKAMKRFAFSFIPVVILEILWNGHSVSSTTTVFIVMVILLFSSIFDYGAQLQQESDETL